MIGVRPRERSEKQTVVCDLHRQAHPPPATEVHVCASNPPELWAWGFHGRCVHLPRAATGVGSRGYGRAVNGYSKVQQAMFHETHHSELVKKGPRVPELDAARGS